MSRCKVCFSSGFTVFLLPGEAGFRDFREMSRVRANPSPLLQTPLSLSSSFIRNTPSLLPFAQCWTFMIVRPSLLRMTLASSLPNVMLLPQLHNSFIWKGVKLLDYYSFLVPSQSWQPANFTHFRLFFKVKKFKKIRRFTGPWPEAYDVVWYDLVSRSRVSQLSIAGRFLRGAAWTVLQLYFRGWPLGKGGRVSFCQPLTRIRDISWKAWRV